MGTGVGEEGMVGRNPTDLGGTRATVPFQENWKESVCALSRFTFRSPMKLFFFTWRQQSRYTSLVSAVISFYE